MKEFSRCPSCGCAVDENLVGHHSAADCSILKYAEHRDDAIRRECAALGKAEWFRDTKTITWSRIERAILATEPAREES